MYCFFCVVVAVCVLIEIICSYFDLDDLLGAFWTYYFLYVMKLDLNMLLYWLMMHFRDVKIQ